jgi:hypothetical protein
MLSNYLLVFDAGFCSHSNRYYCWVNDVRIRSGLRDRFYNISARHF